MATYFESVTLMIERQDWQALGIVAQDFARRLDAIAAMRTTSHLGPAKLVTEPPCDEPVVHWIRSTPITKPAEERGLMCATPYLSNVRASSYREQVTCQLCLQVRK